MRELSALDCTADDIVASFRRDFGEGWALRAMPAAFLSTALPTGTVILRLSRQGVEDVQLSGGLIFVPAVERDPEVFARSRSDEHGGHIFGRLDPMAARVARPPFEPDLSWHLNVAAGTDVPISTASAGGRFLLGVLIAVALLVSLACYAVARAARREAAVRRLKASFISAVSHELRRPLTTLRQLTDLLADGRVLDEDRRRQYVGVLQQETARLRLRVENLLDFERMAAGRAYQFELLDLSERVPHDEVHRGQAGNIAESRAEEDPS